MSFVIRTGKQYLSLDGDTWEEVSYDVVEFTFEENYESHSIPATYGHRFTRTEAGAAGGEVTITYLGTHHGASTSVETVDAFLKQAIRSEDKKLYVAMNAYDGAVSSSNEQFVGVVSVLSLTHFGEFNSINQKDVTLPVDEYAFYNSDQTV